MAKKPTKSTADKRDASVNAGIEELAQWLRDLAQQGFASPSASTDEGWAAMAARMVDAKAGGIGRRLRLMAAATGSAGGPDRLLEPIGKLWLLVQAHRRLAELPPDVAADVRTAIGYTEKQADLASQPGIADRWLVAGVINAKVEDKLRSRRVWLIGQKTGQTAVIIDYAFGGMPYAQHYPLGWCVDSEVVYFPSATPQRAILKPAANPPISAEGAALPTPSPTLDSALAGYSAALGRNPFLERWPVTLAEVIPNDTIPSAAWVLQDVNGVAVPLFPDKYWPLLALSGGHPITVFGEWDGERLCPLSAIANGRLVCFDHN